MNRWYANATRAAFVTALALYSAATTARAHEAPANNPPVIESYYAASGLAIDVTGATLVSGYLVATFSDPDEGDTHTCWAYWSDGKIEAIEPAGQECSVTWSHDQALSIDLLRLMVTDAAGASASTYDTPQLYLPTVFR